MNGQASSSEFQRPITGTIIANGGKVDISGPNPGTTVVQIAGTWTGTIIFEGSNDNITFYPLYSLTNSSLLSISSVTANGLYYVNTNGFQFVQAKATAVITGTANIFGWGSDAASVLITSSTLRGGTDGTAIGNNGSRLLVEASQFGTWDINNISGTISLPTGAATSTNQVNNLQTTQLVNAAGNAVAVKTLGSTPLAADYGLETNSLMYGLTTAGGGGYVPVKVNPSGTMETAANQSGTWNINNISGVISLPTGASTDANQITQITSLQLLDDVPAAQNGAFVKGNTIMGQLDDVSTVAATENNVSAIRITSQRAMHTNLRDSAGLEFGTQTNPFFIDGASEILSPLPAFVARANKVLAAGVTEQISYTMTQDISITDFHFGGRGIGQASLYRIDASATETVPGGGFNSIGDVGLWTNAGIGSSSGLVWAYTTAQFFEGTGSAAVTFTQSDTNNFPAIKYTWSTPKDVSAWNQISAYVRVTVAGGGNQSRSAQIIFTDVNGSTRVYSLTGSTTTAPFSTEQWLQILGTISSPNSEVGVFDPYNVSSITLKLLDGGNKSGTIYWDKIQFLQSQDLIERIYISANTTFQLNVMPTELADIGDVLKLEFKNTDTTSKEYTVVAKGVVR